MYKRVGIKKLGKKTAHRGSMVQNQIRTLFNSGVLKTTTPKAKVAKSKAESLISTMNKKKISLEDRRRLETIFGNSELVNKATKYSKKENAAVSIRKVGFRAGDNAEVSKVELIGFTTKKKKAETKKTEKKETKKIKEVKEENINIETRGERKSTIGKATKSQKKSTERARTRSGL